jgi:hypothetical protein
VHGNISKAHFMCVNSDYLLVSGDQADIISIKEPDKIVSVVKKTNEDFLEIENM